MLVGWGIVGEGSRTLGLIMRQLPHAMDQQFFDQLPKWNKKDSQILMPAWINNSLISSYQNETKRIHESCIQILVPKLKHKMM